MILVLVTICLASCKEVVAATSETETSLTMSSCMISAQQNIAMWVEREYPGYYVKGWRCLFGNREQRT